MDNEQLALKLQETTDRSLRNEGRIKKLEKENDVLHELVTSVTLLAEQMKNMNESVSTLTREVEEIRDRPAKKWDNLADKLLWYAIAAILGYVAAHLGLSI